MICGRTKRSPLGTEPEFMPGVSVYCINAFLLSIVLTLAMEKVGRHVGLVDVPTARKDHEGRIPLVGSAVFLAFCIAALLLHRQPPGFIAFLAGMTLIVAVGIVDDLYDLRAFIKLAAQCAIVTLMVLPNDLVIRNAGSILSEHPLLLYGWAVPVTIFAVVGMINATNLIDGLDGLAGGVSLVALIWFAVAASVLGLPDELLLILILAFSILGFLVFNFRHPWRARAAVFLGDAGSTMLGLSLAFVAISLSQRTDRSLPPVAALWVCALPVIDTLSLIVRRLAAGEGVMAGDHRHLHHLLNRAGLNVSQTVFVLVIISALLGGIGIAGWLLHLPDRVMLLGLAIPILLHSWFCCYGWKHLQLPVRRFAAPGGTVPQMEPTSK
jgi:UDP-GlcNAc:undecaprenyl-phosphate/decaprenyl-phosphate GlcNAc-1-phosphate transferase